MPTILIPSNTNDAGGPQFVGETLLGGDVPWSKILLGALGSNGGPVGVANGMPIGGNEAADGSGTEHRLVTDTGGRQIVVQSDGTNVIGTSAHPVRTDPTGTTAQPVSGTVTANAGTNLNTSALALESGGHLAAIDTNTAKIPPQGQALAAASMPVVLPVAQITTLTPPSNTGYALDTSVTGLQVAQGSTTSGEKGPLIQGAVTTAAPAYTTLQTSPLSLNTSGGLRADVSQLNGTTTDTNSGNKSAGTLRVVLATDQPQLTNKLLVTPDANSPINVAQVNGVTTATGNGVSGTGVQRVTLASDSTGQVAISSAIPAGTNKIGAVSVGQDNQVVYYNGVAYTPTFALIDAAGSGDNPIVAAVTSKQIIVLDFSIEIIGTAITAYFKDGAGNAVRWSSTHPLPLDKTGAAGVGGYNAGFSPYGKMKPTAAGQALILTLSGAQAVGGFVVYIAV